MYSLRIQKGDTSLTVYAKDEDDDVILEIEEYKDYTSICLNQDEVKELISFLQIQLI